MDCRDIRDKLSAYLEEDLSTGGRPQVEGHLKACQECRLALEDLRKTIALTKSIKEAEPPPWLSQKVMARVREEAEQKKGLLRKLFFPLHIKVPLEVFATVAIAVTAFYVFKTVEPEIKQPSFITAPSVDIQETVKKEVPEPHDVQAPKEQPSAVPEPAKEQAESADRVPDAGMAEEAGKLYEEQTVRQEASGTADVRMKKELRSLAPSVMMKAAEAEKQSMVMTLFVKDTLQVSEEIEKTVNKLEGVIIRSEADDNKLFFTVTLDAARVHEFKEALKLLGEVDEGKTLSYTEGDVEIGIKVVKTEARLH